MKDGRRRGVVLVLPRRDGRILMQLRDDKPGIPIPGTWGFFGGSIEEGEEPRTAALRELFEEITYRAKDMDKLGFCTIENEIPAHIFTCTLNVPLSRLTLNEGVDFRLVSLEEAKEGKVYSPRLEKKITLGAPTFMAGIIEKALRQGKDA